MLIVGNGKVLCPDKIIDNGAVFVEDGIIKDIGGSPDLKKKYSKAKFVDAGGGLIMPGLINCHTHLYSSFARGMGLSGEPAKNFVEILERLWWKLDKALTEEDIYYSALVYLISCAKSGTTTIIDHHASPGFVRGSLDKIKDALKMLPVRASLCYEVSDRDGPKVAAAGIEENAGFIEKNKNSDMLQAMFGLHASFTVSDETLKKCIDAAAKLGCGYHVHTAEDKADVHATLEKYGMGVVERWNHFDILGPKTVLAHCVHISDAEKDLLAETATNVVHNPESNMNNAVGTADVPGMLSRGVNVGLGTDGMTADMFQEAKFAHLVRKEASGDPRTGFMDAGKLLFENNARIASNLFGNTLGRIEKGAAADIIVLDYDPPTPLTRNNFLGHFLYGMNSALVKTTIVNGHSLMENKKLLGVDEKSIMDKARKSAKKLWERI